MHFTSQPVGPEETVNGIPDNQGLRSLWFDAAVAYTLKGVTNNSKLKLGMNLPNNGRIITVFSDGSTGSETNINARLELNVLTANRTWLIENESEGGLGFNATVSKSDGQGRLNLQIAGRATRFGEGVLGLTSLTVLSGQSWAPTHLVTFSAIGGVGSVNAQTKIRSQAMLIKKKTGQEFEAYLVTAATDDGGTLAWRNHLDNSEVMMEGRQLSVTGSGVVRQTGRAPVGAVYNDGGKSLVSYYGFLPINGISIVGETWFGSRGDIDGYLELRGRVEGGANTTFTKVGPGLIILSNNSTNNATTNSWGKTELKDGVLRVAGVVSSALPTANIVFDGGILEYDITPPARSLGTGTNQIQWTGDGGFSAYGGLRTVSLNSGAALAWGQQYFVGSGHALLLSSRYANNIVDLSNAINLGSSAGDLREVRVERALSLNSYARLGGRLSGQAGLRKTGPGLLILNNGFNSYTGDTVIEGGALRGGIPNKNTATGQAGSNIVIAGGVLALDADFTRSLGTGGDQIRWTGSGGFAAFGANRTVKLGNSTDLVTWGAPNAIGNGDELRFGYYLADASIIWSNKLELGAWGDEYSIYLERGTNANIPTVVFNEALSGYAEYLNIRGNGRMDLIQATDPDFGLTELRLRGAELRLSEDATISHLEGIDITNGGTLYIKNTAAHTLSNRLGGGVYSLHLNAANIIFDAAFLGASIYHERLADSMHLRGGANRINAASRDLSVFPSIGELVRSNASRSTLSFETPGNISSNYLLLLEEDPSVHLRGGIIPWSVLGSSQFMTVVSGSAFGVEGANYSLTPQMDYNTGPQNTWTDNPNVRTPNVTTTLSLNTNRSVNSLILNQNLNLNGQGLGILSGGLLLGDKPITISGFGTNSRLYAPSLVDNGTIMRNPYPLYIHNKNTLTFTQNARINWDRDVVKSQGGSLILQSNAQHVMGALYIHQGTVELKAGTIRFSVTDPRIYIGDGAGTDILQLRGNVRNQLNTVNANVFPSITLHGTPYDPRGPEYGADQAILRLGGNTKQRLANLHIQDRGTIDWVGGEVSQANILYLNSLTFSGPDAILFMRNWYEYEDYLLVNRGWFDGLTAAQKARLKSQVWFEGYENFPVIHKVYDWQYYQITPFGAPEPATYGAILGAVGLGLWSWQRRRQRTH